MLPGTRQIRLMLSALENAARIVHMNVLAQCTCEHDNYEKALDGIAVSPSMVCCNGTHKIHIVGDNDAW